MSEIPVNWQTMFVILGKKKDVLLQASFSIFGKEKLYKDAVESR